MKLNAKLLGLFVIPLVAAGCSGGSDDLDHPPRAAGSLSKMRGARGAAGPGQPGAPADLQKNFGPGAANVGK